MIFYASVFAFTKTYSNSPITNSNDIIPTNNVISENVKLNEEENDKLNEENCSYENENLSESSSEEEIEKDKPLLNNKNTKNNKIFKLLKKLKTKKDPK
ncbi:MAG: hypothetical protein ACN23H_00690 [Candidatus Phytoplasma vitis]|nr:MAG: hypothetical protein M6G77_00565 [Candidatus Phytoplasma vitis]